MAIRIIKEKIISILKKFPEYRDNDNKLICTIWLSECLNVGVSERSARKVLDLMAEGKLTSPESIRRSRQLIQKQQPDLRGVKYNDRHNYEKTIQKELGYGG